MNDGVGIPERGLQLRLVENAALDEIELRVGKAREQPSAAVHEVVEHAHPCDPASAGGGTNTLPTYPAPPVTRIFIERISFAQAISATPSLHVLNRPGIFGTQPSQYIALLPSRQIVQADRQITLDTTPHSSLPSNAAERAPVMVSGRGFSGWMWIIVRGT
jgi:hypothetical protein